MATERSWVTGLYEGLYWIGMAAVLASLACIVAGNTESVYQFEHSGFPLSWAFAAAAIVAFLAAEFFHPVDDTADETVNEDAELIPDWESVEV